MATDSDDFTARHPDLFITAAETKGVEYAAMFGSDVNHIDKLWAELKQLFAIEDENDMSFVLKLRSLPEDELQKLVLFGMYREMEREEDDGR